MLGVPALPGCPRSLAELEENSPRGGCGSVWRNMASAGGLGPSGTPRGGLASLAGRPGRGRTLPSGSHRTLTRRVPVAEGASRPRHLEGPVGGSSSSCVPGLLFSTSPAGPLSSGLLTSRLSQVCSCPAPPSPGLAPPTQALRPLPGVSPLWALETKARRRRLPPAPLCSLAQQRPGCCGCPGCPSEERGPWACGGREPPHAQAWVRQAVPGRQAPCLLPPPDLLPALPRPGLGHGLGG